MAKSDRVFGLVVILLALGYILSASQLRTSFLSDPMGSKTFPYMMGGVALICGLVMILRPEEEPEWPSFGSWIKIAFSVVTMIGYAYALKPRGFLLPTAVAAGLLSYLIAERVVPAILSGLGLSLGLFFIFKYALGLGLVPFPKGLF